MKVLDQIRFSAMVFMALSAQPLLAQEHHHNEDHSHHQEHDTHEHGKHKIAAYTGFTFVKAAFYEHETHEQSTGKWVPTIGLDYFYTINKTFDIGFIADMELDKYYINEGEEETSLQRNNVVVATPVVKYKPCRGLGLIIGGGLEAEFHEQIKTFAVLKLGIEYEIEIANGWEITPSYMFDYKKEYSTMAYGMSLGYRF